MSINKRTNDYNIRHFGDQVLIRAGNIVSRSVKEIIRGINIIDKEDNYIKNKFKD